MKAEEKEKNKLKKEIAARKERELSIQQIQKTWGQQNNNMNTELIFD